MDAKVETRVVHTVVISLTEDEARNVLVDPAPFKASLRSALANIHAGKDGNGKNGKAKKKAARPKDGQRGRIVSRLNKRANRSSKSSQAAKGGLICEDCGKVFTKPSWLVKHALKDHGRSAEFIAANVVESDVIQQTHE